MLEEKEENVMSGQSKKQLSSQMSKLEKKEFENSNKTNKNEQVI